MAKTEKKKKRAESCSMMAGDIKRLASIAMRFADGQGPGGAVFGPDHRHIHYKISCARKGKWGPGDCGVYEIERSGPGAANLKKKDTVGNLYGLATQLSRDIARLWGCAPGKETAFEGTRSRSRQRRRR